MADLNGAYLSEYSEDLGSRHTRVAGIQLLIVACYGWIPASEDDDSLLK